MSTARAYVGGQPRHVDDLPHDVYACLNAAGEVVYVGVTSWLQRRLDEHALRQPWWSDVARVEIRGGSLPKRDAFDLEQNLIWTLGPVYNRPTRSDITAMTAPTERQTA